MSRVGLCGHRIPDGMRADAKYCSETCKRAAWKAHHRGQLSDPDGQKRYRRNRKLRSGHPYAGTPQYDQMRAEWHDHVGQKRRGHGG